MTGLCSACHNNNLPIAELLLKSGARVNIPDERKSLPLHYAARNGNVTLVNHLIRRGQFTFQCFTEKAEEQPKRSENLSARFDIETRALSSCLQEVK